MENQEISKYKNPMDYLKIFFRRRWLFIIPAIIGLVMGIMAAFLLPPLYESNTLILVEEEKIINPLIQGLAVSTSAGQRMLSLREQLLGWNSLVEIARKLNMVKNVNSQAQFENLIFKLRRNINVQLRNSNVPNAPTIIRIAYFGRDPEQTRIITKTLADQLVEENMRSQSKETDVALNFIKEQLDVYKRKIKESEIADIQQQLNNLLVDSTEQHPLVKELRQKLTSTQKELETGDYKVPVAPVAKDSPAYQALKQELDKLTNENTATQGVAFASNNNEPYDPNNAFYKLILMDKADTVLARDKNVNEMIYNMLLQKLETAKITQRLEASKQGTRYTVIDPPRLPLYPSKPNKLVVVFLGLLLGATSGTGLVFGKEFLDQSFLDIEDAKNSLELPVLGGISRITTAEEINKEKYRVKQWMIIGSIASAVLIISSMLYALFRR
jgi:uncharacterized protein involved in exopolysaccharide biosynthesis